MSSSRYAPATSSSLALIERQLERSQRLVDRIARLYASPIADPLDIAQLADEVFHFYDNFYNYTIDLLIGRADPVTREMTFPNPLDLLDTRSDLELLRAKLL
ncbi:uncharacterized protein CLAFUR5_14644 [Fulvia fulva]|uniref:Uncharacterized protein n=1 Tax=Passalora fulva TaxID=5499 RepID=A0A9Q8PMS6_PASFU|nr:uncharacterized protein CLAFUR5_14644 [Fulvia fulva]KAK4608877.1 hypothetical protein CLAFUR0_14854 [Fulvia fulva]UJO25416.1 hypothetical protein CLAFUR5_14644 [Fulvia fulva]